MTAAHTLLEPASIEPIMADALMTYIDAHDVDMDTPEAEAVFERSRQVVTSMTVAQRFRLVGIIDTLAGCQLRQ
jgi:hypothetical protein